MLYAMMKTNVSAITWRKIHFKEVEQMPKPIDAYPDLMTVEEVAEYLRCCTKTVYEMVRSGQLQRYMVGRQIRVVKSSLLTAA